MIPPPLVLAPRGSATPDLQSVMARLHERDQLAAERQQLSDDLSNLQKNVRDAARDMAPNQPAVAQKLRDALTEMDESDLDNHVQRTADWLRSGINPNSNGTESEIAQGLAKLNQQLQQAQSAMNQAKPGQRGTRQGDESEALDRLSDCAASLKVRTSAERQQWQSQRKQPNNQRSGQQIRNGGNPNHSDRQPSSARKTAATRLGRDQQLPLSRSGNRGANGSAIRPNTGTRNNGGPTATLAWRGGADGTVRGDYDTGNNTPRARGQNQAAPADAPDNPADTERFFEQRMQRAQPASPDWSATIPKPQKISRILRGRCSTLIPTAFLAIQPWSSRCTRRFSTSSTSLNCNCSAMVLQLTLARVSLMLFLLGYQDSVAEYYRRLARTRSDIRIRLCRLRRPQK